MSTGAKRPYESAIIDALSFRALFADCYERWEIAGSLRRKRKEVGDVEHTVIPKFGEAPSSGLFGGTEKVNLLWQRCDQLLFDLAIGKHIYGTREVDDIVIGREDVRYNGPSRTVSIHRWGEKYRGIDFHGFNHEIFCADEDNWGCILSIRTGPPDFSKWLVDTIRLGGIYRQQDGHLVLVKTGETVPVPDEETFFRFAGQRYIEPEKRI